MSICLDYKKDTFHLMLSNKCNVLSSFKERANSIRKCAKVIQQRTKDKAVKRLCMAIRSNKDDSAVIITVDSMVAKLG